jgi:hypothetical protein
LPLRAHCKALIALASFAAALMVVSSADRASGAPSCPKPPIIGAIADSCDRTCIKADDVKRYAIEADIGDGKP